jgi:hypothetical protein
MHCILIFWTLSVLVMGYWFRISEITACLPPLKISSHALCSEDNAQIWTSYGNRIQKINDVSVPPTCALASRQPHVVALQLAAHCVVPAPDVVHVLDASQCFAIVGNKVLWRSKLPMASRPT